MINNCVHTVGHKAVRSADKNVVYFFKFGNTTCNASILVLNVCLGVITYCSNLVIPQVFAANVAKAVI